ncbi:MAG TPA: hypothetical protein DC049_12955 [Spirochaetia bacterium]|nr:hypothetical protein [Spirochaetia bacterium]
MLLDQERKIDDIAQACGFNDLRSFIRNFRALCSMTPGNYRTQFGSPKRKQVFINNP